jgi:hypothetical protein
MEFLEERLKLFDKKINDLKAKICSNQLKTEALIQKSLVIEPLIEQINNKRHQQLEYLDARLTKIITNVNKLARKSPKYQKNSNFRNLFFNKAHRSYYTKQLQYLKSKHDTDEVARHVKLVDFGRVFYQNEFSVYQKFYYFHLYNNEIVRKRCPPDYKGYQYECFYMSKHKYLIQDLERRELVLLNRKLMETKKLQIKSDYSISLLKILNSRIILILYNASTGRKYICITNFELQVIKIRKLNPTQLLVNFGPNNIFFQQTASSKRRSASNRTQFLVLDLDLNILETIDGKLFQERYFVDTNRTHLFNVVKDQVLIKDFMDANSYNIKIVSKTSGDLIQTINNLNYFINRINYFVKIDSDMNIYIINTCKEDGNTLAYLFCYNLHGELQFKRFIPFLNECYYIDFVSENTISFNYLDEVDLF